MPATSTERSAAAVSASAEPQRCFRRSASANGGRSAAARSLVTWPPPTGRTALCRMEPPWKTTIDVVPAPISTSATPSSRSSGVSTASAAARGLPRTSWTCRPARLQHLMRFCPELIDPVTMWTRASSRTPAIPTGSFTPPWSSTMNSCGRTWRTSRSTGSATARAASCTRSTSPWATSRLFTATTPWLLKPLMWLPAEPATTLRISQPAISSASSTALSMAVTVASMLTTVPFLSPVEACVPMPVISMPCSPTSATTTPTLKVPTSRPTTSGFRLAMISRPRRALAAFRSLPAIGGLPAIGRSLRGQRSAHPHDHLVVEDAAHLSDIGRASGPQRQDPAEPIELLGQPAPAEHDGNGRSHRQEGHPGLARDVHLGDWPEPACVPPDEPEQAEGPVHAAGTQALPAIEILPREAGDVRQVAPVGRADGGGDAPVGSDIEQLGRLVPDGDDRRRPVLAYPHHDAVGKLAAQGRGTHPGERAQARLRGAQIDRPDVVSRDEAERRPQVRRRQPPVMADDDVADREVRMAAHQLHDRRRGEAEGDQQDDEPQGLPRHPRKAARPTGAIAAAEAAAYQLPTSRTSGSSHTPLRSHTARWAIAIRTCTSAARARPSFTMKFA